MNEPSDGKQIDSGKTVPPPVRNKTERMYRTAVTGAPRFSLAYPGSDDTEDGTDKTMILNKESTTGLWRTQEFQRNPSKVRRLQRMLDSTQLSLLKDMEENRKINVHKLLHQIHEPDNTEVLLHWDNCFSELPNVEKLFKMKELIADGGQGTIHAAVDKKLRREVALKTLHPELASQNSFRNTFLAEARVTAQLDHPAIIPVHGLYEDDAHNIYLAMKLVKGVTLKAFLEKTCALYEVMRKRQVAENEPVALRDRLDIFMRVCEAISYAHYKKVIHRDLKPANIMLGAFHETYVMDWGIAESQTRTVMPESRGNIAGTIRYIAPEILTRKPYDSRSDIYSLGTMLYELVCLRPMYKAKDGADLRTQVVNHELEPFVHQYGARVDRDMRKIIAKAVEYNPADRYQTVKALLEDLRSYLHAEEVSVNPDGPFMKIFRYFRKYPEVPIFLFLSMLVAIVLYTVGLLFFERQIDYSVNATVQSASASIRKLSKTPSRPVPAPGGKEKTGKFQKNNL